jgi:hypothetical protein
MFALTVVRSTAAPPISEWRRGGGSGEEGMRNPNPLPSVNAVEHRVRCIQARTEKEVALATCGGGGGGKNSEWD